MQDIGGLKRLGDFFHGDIQKKMEKTSNHYGQIPANPYMAYLPIDEWLILMVRMLVNKTIHGWYG